MKKKGNNFKHNKNKSKQLKYSQYLGNYTKKIKLFPNNNTKNLMTFYGKCTVLSKVIMCP